VAPQGSLAGSRQRGGFALPLASAAGRGRFTSSLACAGRVVDSRLGVAGTEKSGAQLAKVQRR